MRLVLGIAKKEKTIEERILKAVFEKLVGLDVEIKIRDMKKSRGPLY